MRTLFGTDGIRGKADQFPLDLPTMFALGEALGHRFPAGDGGKSILLGMDTRESGPRIAGALAGGIASAGGTARLIGVVPTPAVAYLCKVTGAAAGVSISASHNPFEDNGVKVFGADGMKLADSIEKSIEEELLALRKEERVVPAIELASSPDLVQRYEDFLLSSIARDALQGCRIVLDAGHGAAYEIAPRVFRAAGAKVSVIHDGPDGRNINHLSGALHPGKLAETVVEENAHFGVAFDGDADRAIFVDDRGKIRDGDEIIYLWAKRARNEGTLTGDTVVTTVMSNFGFEKQLASDGIRLLRASVGDKYVLEAMQKHGAILGGEQSGHIIDLNVHTTGDGIHTALVLGELLARETRRFSELPTFVPTPQTLVNQRVAAKPPLESLSRYGTVAEECERQLAGRGRILVRYSGTENLVRVMVEGDDASEIATIADRLLTALREEIGA